MTEQRKSRPEETLEIKLNKQMETFSFIPPINIFEERKWLLTVNSFEATNSVFNIIDGNNSFQFQHQIVGLQKVMNFLTKKMNY